MRRAFAVVLLGTVVALAPPLGASAQPPKDKDKAKDSALIKAVTPAAGQARVHIPLEQTSKSALHMKVRMPNPKKGGYKPAPAPKDGAASGSADDRYFRCSAALDTLNRCVVTGKMVASWGYPLPKGPTFVFPEFYIEAEAIRTDPKKGDAHVLILVKNLKFDVIDAAPDGGAQIFGTDLVLHVPDLVKAIGGRPPEPRLYFPAKALELNLSPLLLKPPGEVVKEQDLTNEEPGLPNDPKAEPVPTAIACPLAPSPALAFTSASIDGTDTFTMPDGKVHPVTPYLSSVTQGGSGIIMNIGMARALRLDVDLTKDAEVGMSTARRLRLIQHTIRELRLGTLTGPGLKTPRDLVFENVPIWIEATESEPMLWIGYPFLVKHFKESVLAYTADGKATLHARVNPDLLKEPRAAKKK